MTTKRIRFGYPRQLAECLRVETPGGVVTIQGKLTGENGRPRTRVDVSADGDRYAGELPTWWVPGQVGRAGVCGWLELSPTIGGPATPSPANIDPAAALAALVELTRYAIHGEDRYRSTNPYTKPAIRAALETIHRAYGSRGDVTDALGLADAKEPTRPITLRGHHGNGKPWAFECTGDAEADVVRAILEEHGDSETDTDDVAAAIRAGFPWSAAHLWTSATDTPLTYAVVERYGGIPKGKDGEPEDFAAWSEWHAANSIECPACGAFNFTDKGHPGTCGKCLKPLKGGR